MDWFLCTVVEHSNTFAFILSNKLFSLHLSALYHTHIHTHSHSDQSGAPSGSVYYPECRAVLCDPVLNLYRFIVCSGLMTSFPHLSVYHVGFASLSFCISCLCVFSLVPLCLSGFSV